LLLSIARLLLESDVIVGKGGRGGVEGVGKELVGRRRFGCFFGGRSDVIEQRVHVGHDGVVAR
jgi:hypothetical protein